MSYPVFSVSKRMCDLSGWSLSNLHLQKLLYLSHMVYLGRNRRPLIDGNFEAWDYGPVNAELYHVVKSFGKKPIRNIFNWRDSNITPDVATFLEEAWAEMGGFTPAKLVAATHVAGGAWDRNYNSLRKGVVIPERDILQEYQQFYV